MVKPVLLLLLECSASHRSISDTTPHLQVHRDMEQEERAARAKIAAQQTKGSGKHRGGQGGRGRKSGDGPRAGAPQVLSRNAAMPGSGAPPGRGNSASGEASGRGRGRGRGGGGGGGGGVVKPRLAPGSLTPGCLAPGSSLGGFASSMGPGRGDHQGGFASSAPNQRDQGPRGGGGSGRTFSRAPGPSR